MSTASKPKTPRKPRVPKPNANTLCRECFKKISEDEPYVYAKTRNGKTFFVHYSCYEKTTKGGKPKDEQ